MKNSHEYCSGKKEKNKKLEILDIVLDSGSFFALSLGKLFEI